MKILDCTIRDGGYINNWQFDDNFITNYVENMKLLNIEYIEIGFINNVSMYRNLTSGIYRSLTVQDINRFENIGIKIAVMADFKDINFDILHNKLNIELVRIAFHKADFIDALNMCHKIKELGYKVSANAMAITNYNEEELQTLFGLINGYNIDYLYVADSYGSLSQKELLNITNKFSANLKNTLIGLHLHNNMQNAFSNFEYIKNNDTNVDVVDTTVFGMGRGAGNLQTELTVLSLNPNIDYNVIIDLCIFIQRHIKQIYGVAENKWGYDIDYLLSGFLKMHPNYVGKMRDLNIMMIDRLRLILIIYNHCDYKLFKKEHLQKAMDMYSESTEKNDTYTLNL